MRHILPEETTTGKYRTRKQALGCRLNPKQFKEVPVKTFFHTVDGEKVSCWTLVYKGVVE